MVAFISQLTLAQVGVKFSLLGMRINFGEPPQCRVTGQLLSLEFMAVVSIFQLIQAQVGLKYSLLGTRINLGEPPQCRVTGLLFWLG